MARNTRWARRPLAVVSVVALVVGLGGAAGAEVDPSSPLDTEDRAEVAAAYRDEVFLPDQAVPALGWTGNVGGCVVGTISTAARQSALDRINWYRRMAGLEPVVFDADYNHQSQAAALNMLANPPPLTHNPSPSSACYSADAATGAGKGNLAEGSATSRAPAHVIDLWVDDGSNISPGVGHRSGLLDPRILRTGYGQVQNGSGWAAGQRWLPSSAADLGPRTVTGSGSVAAVPATGQRAVVWPPAGFVPYAHTYRLWSLQYVGACFDDVSITVTGPFGTVHPDPVDLGPHAPDGDPDCLGPGYLPESTVSWDMGPTLGLGAFGGPTVHPRPDGDIDYDVTVTGVDLDGAATSFTYTVTVFDPQDFADVGLAHPFFTEIGWMYSDGVSTGSANPDGPGLVDWPRAAVKRRAMAAFLYRLAGEPPVASPTPHFADVGTGHPFFEEIQWMFEAGVSTGGPNPSGPGVVFQPREVVKRQAMAAFLFRIQDE